MTKKVYMEPLTEVVTLETVAGLLAGSTTVDTLSFGEEGGSTTLQGDLGEGIGGLAPLFSFGE